MGLDQSRKLHWRIELDLGEEDRCWGLVLIFWALLHPGHHSAIVQMCPQVLFPLPSPQWQGEQIFHQHQSREGPTKSSTI